MQDIDFDELDRAVSSALGQDVAPTSTPITTPAPAAAPAAEPVAIRQAVPRPVAPRPSSGRFMDVVHPSSDMKSSAPVPAISTAPSLVETEASTSPLPTSPVTQPVPATTQGPAPLESPFLTDAKVEKRPLGGFAGLDKPAESDEDAVIRSLESEDRPVLAAAEPTVEEVQPVSDKAATSIIPDVPEVVGPTSITQQYTEKAPDDAPQNGSIFDTEAYHKPLTHTAKGRHSVAIVALIIGLALLGAGAGAAIHFFVLPML